MKAIQHLVRQLIRYGCQKPAATLDRLDRYKSQYLQQHGRRFKSIVAAAAYIPFDHL